MRNRRMLVLVPALLLVVGACNSSSATPSPDPKAAFCGALKEYAVAVVDFQQLGPSDSIDAYKAGATAVKDALATIVEEGKDLKEAKVDALVSATTTFVTYLENLPQDVPVAEVKAQAQELFAAIALARKTLGVVVCKEAASPSFAPAASVAAPASPAAS